MKKIFVSMALALSLLPLTSSAQTIDVSQFKQVIELFIALGIIAPDKVDAVRFAFGISIPTVVSTTTPIFSVSQPTPVDVPQVLGTVISPEPVGASIGVITKSDDKNVIPVIFNDADSVSVSTTCEGSLNGQANTVILKKSDFPNGFQFHYGNFGFCEYSLLSFDKNRNAMGGTKDEDGKISRTVRGSFMLN